MPNPGAVALLEQHNADRLTIAGLLAQVRHEHEQARAAAREVWHALGGDASALATLNANFDTALQSLEALNEQCQTRALELIAALKS